MKPYDPFNYFYSKIRKKSFLVTNRSLPIYGYHPVSKLWHLIVCKNKKTVIIWKFQPTTLVNSRPI